MKRIFINSTILVLSFFICWLVLSQIDWLNVLHISSFKIKTEQKLGKLFWEQIEYTKDEITDRDITLPLDSLLDRICVSNQIDASKINLHIVVCNEINAFALPGNYMVVYSGLLNNVTNENELAGILAHELAHIKLKHVMKKLTKEIGFSAILSLSTDNYQGEAIRRSIKLLSSTAFDRQFERNADLLAIEYMHRAKLNPMPFADFLRKMGTNTTLDLSWIETHPRWSERVNYIEEKCRNVRTKNVPVLNQGSWDTMKTLAANYAEF